MTELSHNLHCRGKGGSCLATRHLVKVAFVFLLQIL